jgi:sugar phosphate isomerase/epimerase
MNISRRNMLALAAGGTALGALGGRLLAAETNATKRIPIGLQLYSVRKDCAQDLAGTLKAIGQMGYQGVEFAGYYGQSAEALSKLLKSNGMVCCGTHTALGTLTGNELPKTVEFNKILGNRFLIVPSLPAANLASRQAVIDTAKLLTEIGAKVKSEGMRVGYHAHGGDYRKIEGQTCWDLLFSHAGPDVVMQLDVGNCLDGGGDPVAILKAFPGRTATIHLKEHGGKRGAVVGEGTVPWNEIFTLCETTGKTEWYIVEQESYATTPLESVKLCLASLKRMGK